MKSKLSRSITNTSTDTGMDRPETVVTNSRVTIEATYNITNELLPLIYTPPGGAGQIGVRVEFLLAQGSEGFVMVNTTRQLRSDVGDNDPLLYWIARTDERPEPVLISVGTDEPLSQLRLDGVTDIPPLVTMPNVVVPLDEEDGLTNPLGGPGTSVGQLVVWLEAPTGVRYPLPIRAIGHVTTVEDAEDFFPNAYLALLRQNDGTYRAIAIVPDEGIHGPPNETVIQICDRLTGTDPWTLLLRQLYGCP